MKHVRRVSLEKADAISDLTNTVFVAWKDFLYAQGLGWVDSYDVLAGRFDLDNYSYKKS